MNKIHVHVPYPLIDKHLSLLKQGRFNVEIFFPSSSLDSLTTDDVKRLKHRLDYGPSLSFHAPFMDMSPGAVDSKIRAVTLERFSQVMDIAEALAPETIVFHSGYEKWKYAHRVDIWLEGSLVTWKSIIERASELDIKIAIENIFEDEPSSLEVLMKELHADNFGICFDTGHCNLFSRVALDEWLKKLKSYIFELHLHDNDKTFDQHLPIGEGTFDFKTLFSELKGSDCIYTIEAHTPERVLKSLERLKVALTGSRPGS